MLPNIRFAALVLAVLISIAGCGGDKVAESHRSDYAGQEDRELKTISAEKVSGYLKGRGMGLAKVAELNHYPGPKHVLDLSGELGLTDAQRRQIERAFRDMKSRAQRLGRELVEREGRLDSLFASGKATRAETDALLEKLGELRGRLRFVHVQAHLTTKEILSSSQIERYDELRGYGGGGGGRGVHQAHGHDS